MSDPNHKIKILHQLNGLKHQVWQCSCGKWESRVPDVGPFGRTTTKARIAQVMMAHGKHVKYANLKKEKACPSK